MLSSLLRWRSSPLTPQEEFKKLHATLSTPPMLLPSSTTPDAYSTTEIMCPAHVIDPYHFIICQHGVLGTSADFDNVITDLFVHHEVSVLEAVELAKAAEAERVASSTFYGPCYPTTAPSMLSLRAFPYTNTGAAVMGEGNAGESSAVLSTTLPRTSTPSVTFSMTGTASPTAIFGVQRTSLSNEQPGSDPLSAHETGVKSGERPKAHADPSRPDTALTHAQRTRRDDYKKTFRLSIDYPNHTHGQLYRSGNLRVFSTGSNNYLRSDAGTLACAQKMLAETVPQLHAWLDEVESQERQRRARWAVFARTSNTPRAARLAEEAATPLPVCLSFMAHSFGGIIERECLYLLLSDTKETREANATLYMSILNLRRRLREMNVRFENFLNIATPHCGTGECLWWPIYFGAWCLARLRLCQTYDELILCDGDRVLQTRLLDEPHLKVLGLFRRRVLFANTHRDLLVGFGTCSLIFEKVDTDHTKFVGVPAPETHCAAAFADDVVEISKPIVLRSFMEEAANVGETEERAAYNRYGSRRPRDLTAAVRTYTLRDLDEEGPAFELTTDAVVSPTEDEEDGLEDPLDNNNDFAKDEWKSGDVCSHTLRPQATFSSLSGLTISPVSVISASSASTAGQDSAFAASFTVGHNLPSHAIEEMPLEDVIGSGSWANNGEEDSEENSSSTNGALAVVMAAVNSPSTEFESNCSGPSSVSVSPAASIARRLSVVHYFPFGSSRGNAASDCDTDSAFSSRCSRGSRVTSVLTDPRWTSECVRYAASAMHSELKQRLKAAVPFVYENKRAGKDEETPNAHPIENSMRMPTWPGNTPTPLLSTSSHFVSPDDIPKYRQTPRAIAAKLREKLSWRVRAVRFDNLIPVGHVACLGNWAFCGRSPMLVQSVAEELLMILD